MRRSEEYNIWASVEESAMHGQDNTQELHTWAVSELEVP